MNENIRAHFTKTVDDYDYVADKVVMKNDEIHGVILGSIPFNKEGGIKVLDLGCGTGHGMHMILEKFPNSSITGVDFSNKMIMKCAQKLQDFPGRATLIEKNFNEMEIGKNYDVIVSAIAIHNSNHEQKDKLFGNVFNSLKDCGVFINGDFIEGETFEMNQHYREIYKNHIENNLSGEELTVWLKHAFEEDMPMRLSQQFELLKKHGFSEVKLVWQFANLAVYVAKK